MYNSKSKEELDSSIGITYSVVDGVDTLTFTNVNFKTSEPIAFQTTDTDINIVLVGDNKISTTFSPNNDKYRGIVNWGGSITFSGSGSLEVKSYNLDDGSNKNSIAIAAYKKDSSNSNIIIKGGTIVAEAKGNNGIGIYSKDTVNITGGKVSVYGGNRGNTAGIHAVNKVSI